MSKSKNEYGIKMFRTTFDCPMDFYQALKVKASGRSQNVRQYLTSLILADLHRDLPSIIRRETFEASASKYLKSEIGL